MSRRKTSFLEDLHAIFMKLPWWIPLVVAAGVFLLLVCLIPATTPKSLYAPAIIVYSKIFGYAFTTLILLAGFTSWIKKWLNRELFNSQTNLASIRNLTWREFEQLVGEAFRRQGYTVTETGGGGADGGIDLKLRRDGELVLVQCKQWRAQRVGVKPIRELNGVIGPEGATRAIFVTCGEYTADAMAFAGSANVQLIDGMQLLRLIASVKANSASIQTPIQMAAPMPATMTAPADAPPTCPQCGSPMVKRTARQGQHAGDRFWGCPQYPKCQGIRPL